MPVGFGDGDWVQQAVGRPLLLEMSVPLRTDLTVNDDMGDMDPFRPQFSRHGLRQRTEAEFSDRQIGEARSAAQRCRRAGEEDGAATRLQHRPRRASPDQEAAEAKRAPAPLEFGGIDLEHGTG